MNNDQWFKNRLRGDFAESIATTHFSALGYKVECTGIENTAPSYAHLQSLAKLHRYEVSSYSGEIFTFHSKFPDLIASRISPKPNGEPILNAIFIEVKYRTSVDLAKLRTDLKVQYKHYIDSRYPVFIYLLCQSVTSENDINYKSQIRPKKFRVFFCYLTQENALWWEAGCDSFDKYQMYQQNIKGKKESFNRIYKDIIVPYLDDISFAV